MPHYDFVCHDCKTIFNLHYTSFSAYEVAENYVCSRCNSPNTARKIGRVAIAKGLASRLDALANDVALGNIDESDPKATASFMHKLSQELDANISDKPDDKA